MENQKAEVEKFLKNTLRVDKLTEAHNHAINHLIGLIARRQPPKDNDTLYENYVTTVVKGSPLQKRKFLELHRALNDTKNGRYVNYLMAVPQPA